MKWALLTVAALSGCTHATRAGTVGGLPAWEIDCPGPDRSECLREARSVCEGPYEVVGGSSRATSVQHNPHSPMGAQVGYRHRLRIVCRK